MKQTHATRPVIRTMLSDEHPYLREALYLSIHVGGDDPAPYSHAHAASAAASPVRVSADRALLDKSAFRRTHADWGRAGDTAVVAALLNSGIVPPVGWATQSGTEWLVGAAWVRLYTAEEPTYGFIAPDIPVLVIAMEPGFRDQGIGTELMNTLISEVRRAGMPGISLSVDPTNRAMSFYRKLGFKALDEPVRTIPGDENPVMLLQL